MACVALLTAAIAWQAAGTSRAQETPRCGGLAATIVGSAADDMLVGTPQRDVIWAGPGDDTIEGLDGHDVICGGRGDDVIDGGPGVDTIHGGRGDDTIHGGLGSDVLCGGPGVDTIYGERGNDEIRGGPGEDRLYGGHGDDQVNGDGGDDFIHGGLGIDVLKGGRGDDSVDGSYGWDVLDGGRGRDTVSFASAPRSNHRGGGVRVSLRKGRATGDGRDRLRRFESVVSSAFGPRRSLGAPVAVYFDTDAPHPAAAGVVVASGRRSDEVTLSLDPGSRMLTVTATAGVAIHGACERPGASRNEAACPLGEPPRWVTVDLGQGDDSFRVAGSLLGVGGVRVAGGPGDDELHGGAENSLLEGGPGSDRLFGGDGQDALIAGFPGGGDFLAGGPGGNLLAAGPPCSGGRIVGGSGSDNVSFAELPIQRGVLYASLARRIAYVKGQRNCRPIRFAGPIENLEGSFGADILVGDQNDNNILGQPGADRFYGGGGDNIIDARDGGGDAHIQCARRGSRGLALVDRRDPAPRSCAEVRVGEPIPGLPK